MTSASKQWSMLIADYITHAATMFTSVNQEKNLKNQPQDCCRADHRAHHH
jgi:hypothetical protein